MRILLLGYGNPGRGDDGVGPVLVDRLEQRFLQAKHNECRFDFLTAMQLQPEHILDMEAHERVLLVDAGMGMPAPFSFEQVHPLRDDSFSTHALSPWSLLAIYRDTLHKEPPATFLLTVLGENFALGAPFSSVVLTRMDKIFGFVASLQRPDSAWLQQECAGERDARAVSG